MEGGSAWAFGIRLSRRGERMEGKGNKEGRERNDGEETGSGPTVTPLREPPRLFGCAADSACRASRPPPCSAGCQ